MDSDCHGIRDCLTYLLLMCGSGAGGASDTDKISTQLFLDVQEYGSQLAKFGIKAASLESYQLLWKCVAPEDQQEITL